MGISRGREDGKGKVLSSLAAANSIVRNYLSPNSVSSCPVGLRILAFRPLSGKLKNITLGVLCGSAVKTKNPFRVRFKPQVLRVVVNFDFYDKTEFELDTILRQFRQFFKKLSVIQMSNGTLIVDVEGIQVSVFYYDYKVIRPFFHTKHLLLLSLEDISAMKLIAIIQRGERQALTYFEEAEGALPGSRIGIFNDRPGWGEVKEYLSQ